MIKKLLLSFALIVVSTRLHSQEFEEQKNDKHDLESGTSMPRRPQEPQPPYPYAIHEVKIPGPEAGIELAGTLTLPSYSEKYPVALLIAGSGPNNRDEEVFDHKPFWILSDHLTRHGIAVLRVDKRGVAESTGDLSRATSRDFANDVHACIAFLKDHEQINAAQIGLIGHSEGGVIAPLVALEDPSIAWIVSLAGFAVKGDQVLRTQLVDILRVYGESQEGIALRLELQTQMVQIVQEEQDKALALQLLRDYVETFFAQLPKKVKEQFALQLLHEQCALINSPWFRYLINYDPAEVLTKMRTPIFVMIGERDLQVSAKENLPLFAQYLDEAQNPDASVVCLPHLNHLLQTSLTGSPAEYWVIEETISPTLLNILTAWISARLPQVGSNTDEVQNIFSNSGG